MLRPVRRHLNRATITIATQRQFRLSQSPNQYRRSSTTPGRNSVRVAKHLRRAQHAAPLRRIEDRRRDVWRATNPAPKTLDLRSCGTMSPWIIFLYTNKHLTSFLFSGKKVFVTLELRQSDVLSSKIYEFRQLRLVPRNAGTCTEPAERVLPALLTLLSLL